MLSRPNLVFVSLVLKAGCSSLGWDLLGSAFPKLVFMALRNSIHSSRSYYSIRSLAGWKDTTQQQEQDSAGEDSNQS